ncbi:MAG: hypothetical protein ACI8TX_000130 [Hyphomicrobiaceae bacterium]
MACLCASAVGLLVTLRVIATSVEYVRPGIPAVTSDSVVGLDEKLKAGAATSPSTHRVALFGDSLTLAFQCNVLNPGSELDCYTDSVLVGLRERIKSEFKDHGGGDLVDVVNPGLGPLGFWMISDRVGALKPQLAIVEFNLLELADQIFKTDNTPYAALLPAARWPEGIARLPLSKFGLSTDTMITWRSTYAVGGLQALRQVQRMQVRANQIYNDAAQSLRRRTLPQVTTATPRAIAAGTMAVPDIQTHSGDGRSRATELFAHVIFDPTMAGAATNHPALKALEATVEILREYGTEVLVYVAPRNIEYLRSINVLNEVGLAKTLNSVRTVSTRAQAEFLDLHDFLPDSAFCDQGDHLCPPNQADGVARLSTRLMEAVRELLGERP